MYILDTFAIQVNILADKVLIGVCHGQTVFADFMWSLISLEKPEGTNLYPVGTTTLLEQGRNEICKGGVNGGYSHVFFIDSDNTLRADALRVLLSRNADIVTGIYPYKSPRAGPTPVLKKKTKEGKYEDMTDFNEKGPPFEVDGCGSGCLLIKTEVLKKMGYPFFKTEVDKDKNYTGEDIYFCKKAQGVGFKILADPSVLVGHLDTIEFTLEQFFAQRDKKRQFLDGNPKQEFQIKCVKCGKGFTDSMEGEMLWNWWFGNRNTMRVVTVCPHCKTEQDF